jgi:hypothetical protein
MTVTERADADPATRPPGQMTENDFRSLLGCLTTVTDRPGRTVRPRCRIRARPPGQERRRQPC